MAEMISFVAEGNVDATGHLESLLREGIWLNCTDPFKRFMHPKPYEYANMGLVTIDPSAVLPTAKYVLKSQLAVIKALYEELMPQGINIFDLRGILEIDKNNYMCPPILEVWGEAPYNSRPVIVDGAHRIYTTMQMGIPITCFEISGNISSMLPVLPLAGWHEVHELDTVPEDKRNYHPGIPAPWKPYELYRQTIPGSTGPRLTS